MQAVAFTRIGQVAKRYVVIKATFPQVGHALVGASPKIAPSVREDSPHDVVGNGVRRTRVVQGMPYGLVLLIVYIQTVVRTGIYKTCVYRKRLHRIARQRADVLKTLSVVSVKSTLRTDPCRSTVAKKRIDERLAPLPYAYGLSLAVTQDGQTGQGADEQTMTSRQQRIDIMQPGVLRTLRACLQVTAEESLRTSIPQASAVYRHGTHLALVAGSPLCITSPADVIRHESALRSHI